VAANLKLGTGSAAVGAAKKVEAPGSGWRCHGSYIELHGGRIWVQSQLGAVRPSRSRSQCVVANEQMLIAEDNPENLKSYGTRCR
jgi:hypothetical protein